MPTYTSVDGVSREHTNWPLAVDGISRETVSMLGSVDGIQREVFAASVWEKYSVTKTSTFSAERNECSAFATVPSHKYVFFFESYTRAGNKFKLSGDSTRYMPYGTSSSSDRSKLWTVYHTDCIYTSGNVYSEANSENLAKEQSQSLSKVYELDVMKSDFCPAKLGGYKIELIEQVSISKGSFIGMVGDRDPNAYPENGEQDGCWCVKIR